MEWLDETDFRLLSALEANARLSYAELGRLVNLTPPAVTARMHRLEEKGIITGYRAEINQAALCESCITLFVRMAVPHNRERRFRQFIGDCKEIVEGYFISGSETFLLKVMVESTEMLNRLISYFVEYGQPTTALVIEKLPQFLGNGVRIKGDMHWKQLA